MSNFQLQSPSGSKVTVRNEERAQVLVKRGYKSLDGKVGKKKTSDSTQTSTTSKEESSGSKKES